MTVQTILAKQFEGCKLTSYKDPVGVWTIGYGHTLGVCEGLTCTQEQAEQWLLEDLSTAEQAVNHFVKTPLTQGQFDALVDFTFNLGSNNLRQSTLLKKLNSGDYRGAAEEFLRWIYAKGKPLEGLRRRRVAEKKLFEGEINA